MARFKLQNSIHNHLLHTCKSLTISRLLLDNPYDI